ncbi:hypothetical protein AVEN_176866-1, partial [Araneus ventricosus]
MKRIVSVKVSPISESVISTTQSQRDLAKYESSNLTLSSNASEIYEDKSINLSKDIINLDCRVNNGSNLTIIDGRIIPTAHDAAKYKAWWEKGENIDDSATDSNLDNYDFNLKQSELKYSAYPAVLIHSPSLKGDSCIPFTFKIFEDLPKSATVVNKQSKDFLDTCFEDSTNESQVNYSWKKKENPNAACSFKTQDKLNKKIQYVIPIPSKKYNQESHSERVPVGPLLINIKTYDKTTEMPNTKKSRSYETLSNKLESTSKSKTQYLPHYDSICNQPPSIAEQMTNLESHRSSKITVDGILSMVNSSSEDKNISGKSDSFKKNIEKKKVKSVYSRKISTISPHKCTKAFKDKCRYQLT